MFIMLNTSNSETVTKKQVKETQSRKLVFEVIAFADRKITKLGICI